MCSWEQTNHCGFLREGNHSMEMTMSNEEVVQLIKVRLDEKNEVIREQQIQIHELQTALTEAQDKVRECEERLAQIDQAQSLRDNLIQSITEVLD